MNEMEQIQIHKVTVNIGIGEVGEDVQKAANLVERLTGSTAVKTQSGDDAKGFGLRSGLDIGAMTTLRGEDAYDLLERLFDAREDNIHINNFDDQGNLSFGIGEYINIPGIEYDPDIGMMGLEVAVTLERPGFRVKRRKEDSREIGQDHRITPQEAANYMIDQFGVDIDGVEQ
ncbi:MAG: 50S ribosomal protein L5 [Candidatus Nanohaloarchaeota archaeon QJJ-5]|nr:50S ribosomal protein L5 [Candidatus Nanohaloarchaeota archaeon QJJ-5]